VQSERQPRRGALRVLLIGGVETRFHHFDELRAVLARVIAGAGASCTSLLASDAFRPEVLRRFDAIVSITTGGTLDEAEESALLGAVAENRNDAGRPVHFLGVHGASCSFSNSQRYAEMLGGRFLRHPPMGRFRVEIDAPDHPVTTGVDAFDIYDELYLLELCSPLQVLLSAWHAEPEVTPEVPARRVPLGWVRAHGEGKVCYVALGHGPEQLEHPSVKRLVSQALDWFGDE
jgi:uncharacterized protein